MCVTSKNTLEIAHRPCYSRFTTSGCLCIVDEFALQSFFCFSGKKNKQKKKQNSLIQTHFAKVLIGFQHTHIPLLILQVSGVDYPTSIHGHPKAFR